MNTIHALLLNLEDEDARKAVDEDLDRIRRGLDPMGDQRGAAQLAQMMRPKRG